MSKLACVALLLSLSLTFSLRAPGDNQAASVPAGRTPIDRVRFFPMAGREAAMVGGKFTGSNESNHSGFQTLAEITTAPPAGQWTEMKLPTTTFYRWLRYEAPPGSHGNVAEIEFYLGDRKMGFGTFGSLGNRNIHPYQMAMDGKTDTYFDSDQADGQYVGTDVGYWVDPQPAFVPKDAAGGPPVKLTMAWDNTPNTTVRYAFDGDPGPDGGQVYSGPITLDHSCSVFARAFRPGLAESPLTDGTYLIGDPPKPGLTTLHIGNSLSGSGRPLTKYALAAGWQHDYHDFILGGAPIKSIWDVYITAPDKPTNDKVSWNQLMGSLTKLDDFTLQVHDVKMSEEADYDNRFVKLITTKFPDAQPWLYSVWAEMFKPEREVPLGQVPSLQMKTLYPAPTWPEQASAWLLYAEDVRATMLQNYTAKKKIGILPNSIAAGWLKTLIDEGKLPGIKPEDFPFMMFLDNFHPGPAGRYLVDLVWYSAFYRESPVGKIPPVETELTGAQAAVLQQLAWDVVRNYPPCGLYQEGTTPVSAPTFSYGTPTADSTTPVTLTSSTPGAWFRYTLDGTVPARECGYVYCGPISLKPGMTLKAIAYESGMADSPVAQAQPPGGP